jgi:hypothetical protein
MQQVQFIFSSGVRTEIALGRKFCGTQMSGNATVAGRKTHWTQKSGRNRPGRNCRRFVIASSKLYETYKLALLLYFC